MCGGSLEERVVDDMDTGTSLTPSLLGTAAETRSMQHLFLCALYIVSDILRARLSDVANANISYMGGNGKNL